MADELSRALAANRRQLELRERQAFGQIMSAYTGSYKRLQRALDELHERIEQAVASGETISPSWLHQQHRYIELQAQIGRELQQAAQVTGQVVTGEVAAAIDLGQQHAQGLVRTSLGAPPAGAAGLFGSWATLNRGAVEAMLGFVHGPGSPVGKLLATLAPVGKQQLGQVLTDGIVRGLGARETGRLLSRAMGGQAARALTIARTETLRAYRESTRQSYQANKRLVLKWEWVSALDRRTCAACYAMHGQIFPTDEKLDGHPNCRCTMVPLTPTWHELGQQIGVDLGGVDETRPLLTTGESVFSRLNDETQLHILGRRKFELYQQGKIGLRDLVKRTRSATWGTMRSEASTAEALEHAKVRRPTPRRQPTAAPVAPAPRRAGTVKPSARYDVAGVRGPERVAARNEVTNALDAVDNVVALDRLPEKRIKLTLQERETSRGYMKPERRRPDGLLQAHQVNIDPKSTHPALTTAHEVGHQLDLDAFGFPGQYVVSGSPAQIASWLADGKITPELANALLEYDAAIHASAAVKALEALPRDSLVVYYRGRKELWARSFAQYVAKHGGDETMLAQLERDVAVQRSAAADGTTRWVYTLQWEDDDFAPIDAAIRKVIEAAGLAP